MLFKRYDIGNFHIKWIDIEVERKSLSDDIFYKKKIEVYVCGDYILSFFFWGGGIL